MGDRLTEPLTKLTRAAYEQGYKHGVAALVAERAEAQRLRAQLSDIQQHDAGVFERQQAALVAERGLSDALADELEKLYPTCDAIRAWRVARGGQQ